MFSEHINVSVFERKLVHVIKVSVREASEREAKRNSNPVFSRGVMCFIFE